MSAVRSEDEFERMLLSLRGSPQGAWLLDKLEARAASRDTQSILAAIGEVRTLLAQERKAAMGDLFHAELKQMIAAIATARSEIAAIKPVDAPASRIMAATEELDAIVTATERATSDILGAAERLLKVAEELRASDAPAKTVAEVEAQATTILMACSFQDITGQRTQKVVNLLRYLETRVNAMLDLWGVAAAQGMVPPSLAHSPYDPLDKRPDAHLLTGPAPEGMGTAQDEIDRLLDAGLAPCEAALAGESRTPPSRPPAPAAPAPAPESARGPAAPSPISQDEIDDLFSGEAA